jgi:hypothetical protein
MAHGSGGQVPKLAMCWTLRPSHLENPCYGKISQLREAFTGHFDDDHRFLVAKMLARVDGIDTDVAARDAQIGTHLARFARSRCGLRSQASGRSRAAVIIAEIAWT